MKTHDPMNPAIKISPWDEAKNDLQNWRAENNKIDDNKETINDREVWTAEKYEIMYYF
jgi:hypothetical protein